MKRNIIFSNVIFLSLICTFFSFVVKSYCQVDNVLLWNKLGNDIEATNSEVGPNGTIVGTMNYYPAKFDMGAQPSGGGSNHYIGFDATILNTEQGCIELWYNNFSQPDDYKGAGHEFHGMVNSRFDVMRDRNLVINYDFYYFGVFNFSGYVRFNGPIARGVTSNEIIPLGLHHIALVWDRNGIDNTNDYVRLYLDGTILGSESTLNDWGTNSTDIMKVACNRGTFVPPPNQCYAVDNIKIWNYAKSDFSDRFMEAPTIELAIEELFDSIIDYELPAGIENSLTSTLENAEKSFEQENTTAGMNQLEALINKIEAQRGKKISEEEADELIASIQIIIDAVESGLSKNNSASSQIIMVKKISQQFELKQNYPNPFNPTTTISYSIPIDGYVSLSIHDVLGKEIAVLVHGYKTAGIYSSSFDAGNLTSGIYFYKLQAGNFVESKKMILLK